jgi:F-type H+-transporting ATPase subunit epsilon
MSESAATQFDLVVVSPDNIIFDGQATRLIAPSTSQDLAILPNHTPLYAQLVAGDLLVTTEDGSTQRFPIDGGIIRVKGNRVSIIVGFDVLRR